MKKFIACLFILLIFGGFVFYLGLAQLKIAPDSYGIIVSKTGGIDEEVIKSGEKSWKKEFLIPTNARILEFKINPVTVDATISGQLPSGELYASIFSSQNNFSYSISYSIDLTFSPESLVELYRLNRITDSDSLEKYLDTAGKTIAQLSTNYILNRAKENPSFRPESIRREELIKSIKFYTEYPDVELFAFAITDSKLPDFNLYNRLVNQFALNQERYFSAQNMQDKNERNTQNNNGNNGRNSDKKENLLSSPETSDSAAKDGFHESE